MHSRSARALLTLLTLLGLVGCRAFGGDIECVDDDTCLVICEGPDGRECEIEIDCEEACSKPCTLTNASASCTTK